MKSMEYANYLPDELLLEVLEYIEHWQTQQRQSTLARFCGVNRQWYDVAVRKLYEAPYLSGRAYEYFVRTVCPSVIAHIKPSSLSGLVRVLDLSHIVHNSNKATTARTLNINISLIMPQDAISQLSVFSFMFETTILTSNQASSTAPSPLSKSSSRPKPPSPSTAGPRYPNACVSAFSTSASSQNASATKCSIRRSANCPS